MADDAGGESWQAGVVVLFLLIVVLIGWDLGIDRARGTGASHLLAESAVLLLALVGALRQGRALLGARRELRAVQADLARARDEASRWRNDTRELVQGLGAAIQQQFGRWGLSAAEAQIGLLLLKGLSLKEVANLRQTSERTVREQAGSLYRKAGLGGRASLSAFFLEDLLLPVAPDGERRAP